MFHGLQILRAVQRFARNRDGNVLILSALSLPVIIGTAALVAEYGDALLKRVENQRAADLASYAGAIAYDKTKSETDMTKAAKNVALLNGIAASDVQVSLVPSPRNVKNKAVSVS
ncbi:MAG: hypothetical protein JNL61_09470, partial [Rhizobiaceae bacterium]|nr:hypothetical protein [Rhizobiaceae bacterium]